MKRKLQLVIRQSFLQTNILKILLSKTIFVCYLMINLLRIETEHTTLQIKISEDASTVIHTSMYEIHRKDCFIKTPVVTVCLCMFQIL
jgi:hypothetical protein